MTESDPRDAGRDSSGEPDLQMDGRVWLSWKVWAFLAFIVLVIGLAILIPRL